MFKTCKSLIKSGNFFKETIEYNATNNALCGTLLYQHNHNWNIQPFSPTKRFYSSIDSISSENKNINLNSQDDDSNAPTPTGEEILRVLRLHYGKTLPVSSFKDAVSTYFPKIKPEECGQLLQNLIYQSNISVLKSIIHLQSSNEIEDRLNNELSSLESVQDSKIQKLLHELKHLKEGLNKLQVEKDVLDRKASSNVRKIIYGSFLYLTLQTSIYAKFTWYDFGWDIMEPVTYFTTFTTITLSYLYFLIHGGEYTYEHASQYLLAKQRGKLYFKHQFNIYEYERLISEAESIQRAIEMESVRIHGYLKNEYKDLFYSRSLPPKI